jgi:hypothetical protein
MSVNKKQVQSMGISDHHFEYFYDGISSRDTIRT